GRLELVEILGSFGRVFAASLVLAALAFPVWSLLDDALGRGFLGQVVSLGSGLAAGLGGYLLTCRLLGVRELEALLSLGGRLHRA
nr:hypothetical protein [Actinomycetota bacterium]